MSKAAHYNQGWTRISATSIWLGSLKNWNICFLPHKKDWMLHSCSKITFGSQWPVCKHWARGRCLHFWKYSRHTGWPVFDGFNTQMALLFNVFPETMKDRIKRLFCVTGRKSESIQSNKDFSWPVGYSTWNILHHQSWSSYFPWEHSNV